ncbi:LysR family transcriptional regulator [Aquabacter sp. P-9]|uniref:LysR family transcriptional regulator n=1 Tax=Aquabacter sediminis TaxID=3029197 RepID=UPI00237DC08A|nr:LysR family transcriptional regulator [Aquabacter sp. P-9]MDE1567630.1 LysR family transcriptional regulator [Aquabacter sp. P-9]
MLENMRAFVQAVESESFSEAGRRLRLSANVVSHRIQMLEKHLGCRLFNRTTRRMSLTEQGRVFYENITEALRLIEAAESNVTELGAMPRGGLRVTAPLNLGRRLVAPVAARYQEAHPQIDVRLRLSEHTLDLIAESVDLALRLATFEDSSMIMRKVARIDRVACAAPDYLARCGVPQTPSDLLRHQCLLLRFAGAREFRWTLTDQGKELAVPVSGHLEADDGDVLTVWAMEGRGIVVKPRFEVADALADGRLVPVLASHPPVSVTLAVLYPARQLVPLKVKAFADMLLDEGRRFLSRELAKIGEKLTG